MADMAKSVRDRLLAHSGVSAKVSSGKRVYYEMLPADPTLPAIVLEEIPGVSEGVMGDDTGHVLGGIRTWSVGDTRAEAKELGEEVRDALQRYSGTHLSSVLTFIQLTDNGVSYRSDGRNWWHELEHELWFTETV